MAIPMGLTATTINVKRKNITLFKKGNLIKLPFLRLILMLAYEMPVGCKR